MPAGFYGQSMTTPSGGPWQSITFYMFDAVSHNGFGVGNLYVLSQSYAGQPAQLSAATPGFVGVTSTLGGGWVFGPSVILQPNTKYYFYMDTASPVPLVAGDSFPGGELYSAASAVSGYSPDVSLDLDFFVTGNRVSNPAPIPGAGLLSYLLLGCGGAAACRRRLRTGAAAALAMLKRRTPLATAEAAG